MARTVVAIYDSFHTANEAVRDLVDGGFPRDNISIVANNTSGEFGYNQSEVAQDKAETTAEESGAGAGVGAGIGAAIGGIGGLLIGLGALTIPGIGPVIAAGPLAVALSTLTGAGVGAVAGGVTGGLLGALIGLGVPEEEAQYYAEGVRRGGVLVTVQAEEYNTEQIMEILNRHNPMDLNQQVEKWREQGWKGFNASVQPNQAVTLPADHQPENWSTETTQRIPDTGYNAVQDPERTIPVPSNTASIFGSSFDVGNPVYRNHYATYLADSGYPFDYYVPGYQYGYGLASDARYKNRSWDQVEPAIQQDWEYQHPGTWERFKASIRHAWEDATGQDRGY